MSNLNEGPLAESNQQGPCEESGKENPDEYKRLHGVFRQKRPTEEGDDAVSGGPFQGQYKLANELFCSRTN
jgi:hypothetical protein